jgi:glycosyltransferase involved in cell wall biosynthesis
LKAPAAKPTPLQRVRGALYRVPPMVGAPMRELGRMATLAMLAGDWPTAAEAARERLARAPEDEAALVALSVALWELGDEQAARTVALGGNGSRSEAQLRAAARFFHYVDEPAAAQAAVDGLHRPAAGLELGVGEAWRRHGDFEQALAGARRVLDRQPGDPFATTLGDWARAEQAVVRGAWRPAVGEPRPLAPVAGRVLHMLQRSLPHHRSGSTYRTGYTVQAQLAAGLDPVVVTQPGFPAVRPAAALEDVDGVPHHRLGGLGAEQPVDERLREYLLGAAPVVEQVRPAVLHPASDYVNALVAIELGRRYGIPVVYEVRGFPEVVVGRWAPSRATYEKAQWRRALEAECWRRADRVVTLAEVMKRHIVAHGVPEERVVVAPNAVDMDTFRPAAADPALRARLGIAEGDFVLGYVSTLSPYEGVDVLVEAVARLRRAGHPVRALIVGEGQQRVPLAQLAHRLGVGDRVVLTGRVAHEHVGAHLALMDLFTVPRTAEVTCQLVTPLKPYEAMAAGKAVAVSRTEALTEMVEEGVTGLTFTPEDPEDLARLVERLIADRGEVAALGARARDWVRAQRTWGGNAERYLALYRELGAA